MDNDTSHVKWLLYETRKNTSNGNWCGLAARSPYDVIVTTDFGVDSRFEQNTDQKADH